jgi:D-lactate dehydrogenase
MGFAINKVFGKKAMFKLTAGIKKIIPVMPLWSEHLDQPPHLSFLKQNDYNAYKSTIVYFPACISRMLGSYKGKRKNLMETFISICNKAEISVVLMDNISGSCCSQIFSSKGFKDAYTYTANRIVERLWKSTREGSLPVVIDVSSCAYTLKNIRPVLTDENKEKFERLTIMDSVDFLHDEVMDFVDVKEKKGSVVLHPVCSLQKMKTQHKFVRLAHHFSNEVTVPKYAGCCGMAGDRGFLFPELTTAATNPEALEVQQKKYDGYYSSTKTCEIALSDAVKENYESILYLVDEATGS